jgi:NAD(P)-dependent dehydrogenase (short-subunit alcohol dehydrogenase family)
MRVLLLGGTAEARALAARLHPRVEVISSLAGRVPDPALPAALVDGAVGRFGQLDTVIHAAGFADKTPFAEAQDATFAKSLDTVLWGFLRLARAALPHLRDGRIVAISSFVAPRALALRTWASMQPWHLVVTATASAMNSRVLASMCFVVEAPRFSAPKPLKSSGCSAENSLPRSRRPAL